MSKKTRFKVLLLSLLIVCLVLVVGYFARQAIVKTYYGELESFDYYAGGGILDYSEHYVITRDGEDYTLSVFVHEDMDMTIERPIEPTEIANILNIIASENLYLRNGVNAAEENPVNIHRETLTAVFSQATLSYQYSGSSVYRNNALADYLYQLAEESIGTYGSRMTTAMSIPTGSTVAETFTEETTI